MPDEILTNDQMAEADKAEIASGTDSFTLMQNAGIAVGDEIAARFSKRPVLVACGPGNNGGDGLIAAARLKELGWPVSLALMGGSEELKGDSAKAALHWQGEVAKLEDVFPRKGELVVDAVFGTGFKGPFRGPAEKFFEHLHTCGAETVAVDMPSGLNGDSGEAEEHTPRALLTVTFARKKRAHVLPEGIDYCGTVIVKDIGVGDGAVYGVGCDIFENSPGLYWGREVQAGKSPLGHKYHYGHVAVFGAPELTGATNLAAQSAARVGAGLVTVYAKDNADLFRSILPPHILVRDNEKFIDDRVNALLYGPGGLPQKPDFKEKKRSVILDADALADLPDELNDNFILTPHEGEFDRIFPDLKGTVIDKAQKAAKQSGALIVLKGPSTVIAHPRGDTLVNIHSSPHLASAGTGDVLAGMITGFCAYGLRPFSAAASAVWMHGEAGRRIGRGLVASDMPEMIARVLKDFS